MQRQERNVLCCGPWFQKSFPDLSRVTGPRPRLTREALLLDRERATRRVWVGHLQGCPGPEKPRPRPKPRLPLWLWVGLRRVRSAPREGRFPEGPESFEVDAHRAPCGKILGSERCRALLMISQRLRVSGNGTRFTPGSSHAPALSPAYDRGHLGHSALST